MSQEQMAGARAMPSPSRHASPTVTARSFSGGCGGRSGPGVGVHVHAGHPACPLDLRPMARGWCIGRGPRLQSSLAWRQRVRSRQSSVHAARHIFCMATSPRTDEVASTETEVPRHHGLKEVDQAPESEGRRSAAGSKTKDRDLGEVHGQVDGLFGASAAFKASLCGEGKEKAAESLAIPQGAAQRGHGQKIKLRFRPSPHPQNLQNRLRTKFVGPEPKGGRGGGRNGVAASSKQRPHQEAAGATTIQN